MEIDSEKDENEPELTYPYEEVDPLNLLLPASESEPDDKIKVENPIEHEDETVPASVHGTTHALVEKKGKAKDKLYGKLILELGNEVCSNVEQGTTAMEKLVEKLGNTEDMVECKKLKKELEEARDSVDAAIAVERARQTNVRNDASGSGPVRGQDATPAVRECTFVGFMKCNPAVFREEVQRMEHELWNLKVKEYNSVSYTLRINQLALMCLRMVEPKRVKVDAYIRGLTDNIKGEVTPSKPADLNEAVLMAHKIAKSKEMRELWLPLLLMESFLCVNDVLLAMLASVRSSVTSVERLGVRKGIAWRRVLPRGLMLSLFRLVMIVVSKVILGIDVQRRSFVDTRFSVMLDIDPIKIGASYEVELADGRVASTNTVLKGCTLNLVNHIFEIDLMSIELGTFDVIIGMDWLVKHDAVIICGEKVVRIMTSVFSTSLYYV
uniref:Reverse transcriptase domain-containing protein n=1 Tax=Tanacetum cinerariifolium TaxID=118510 RepID=A0A6L2N202_TANCI|nr:reverse transcriptase domain-containing protein [Tanacetum cinerariifolium]